jgi:16S rRNA (guanine527-N7)-methyltransferase
MSERHQRELRLQQAAESLGLGALDDAVIGRLLSYLDLLQRWNKVYNLTAVRDPDEMLQLHLIDSLALLPALRAQCAAQGGAPIDLLDVGSGGGLPGLVIASVQPDWSVTCVDAVAKKATFIRQVAAELGLTRVTALHARVENLSRQWPLITSRAFASLVDFTALTRSLLAPQGCWVAMKGQMPQAEIDALSPGIEVFHVEPLKVPGLDAQRCLIWMRQSGPSGEAAA